MISGIVDLILAAIVLAGSPCDRALGARVLVGINMVFGGVALAAMGFHARRAA